MSRFSERVERDLGQIADRATSSSAAWEAIRQRIDQQETTGATAEVIRLAPDRNDARTPAHAWTLVAAAIATLALVGGLIIAGLRTDQNLVLGDDPGSSVLSEPAEPESGVASAHPLPFVGSELAAGRYSTPLLGVPLTMTVDDEWSIAEAGASSIALHSPIGEGEIDVATIRWVFLARLGGWNTPAEAIDPAFRTTGSIGPNDIDRWLDENDVVVLERRDALVDGREAEVVDLRVDPAGTSAPLDFPRDPFTRYNDTCGPDTRPCFWYRSVPAESDHGRGPRPDPVVHAGQTRRLWLIPIDGLEPILIEAVVPVGDERWLDDFEHTTVMSLELGNDASPLGAG